MMDTCKMGTVEEMFFFGLLNLSLKAFILEWRWSLDFGLSFGHLNLFFIFFLAIYFANSVAYHEIK